MMEISVQILSDPAVLVTGQTKPVSVRSLGRVVIFLVFLRGASISREEMARLLWPGEPDEVVANRLRVSLNRVKNLIGRALESDRLSVRLSGISSSVDVWEEEKRLRVALDEVDLDYQLEVLMASADAIGSKDWREFADLDTEGTLARWDEVCRQSLRRITATAVKNSDWNSIDFAWNLMRSRRDFDREICERFLDAHDALRSLDEGFRLLRQAASDLDVDLEGELFKSLGGYWKKLKEVGQGDRGFQVTHSQLLGGALLSALSSSAPMLVDLVVKPEIQFYMQSSPSEYLQILEVVQGHLEIGSISWVAIEVARVSAYSSLYDSKKVIEISQSLFSFELTDNQAANAWMIYSFSLFHHRRWDEALAAVRSGQVVAQRIESNERYEMLRTTEAAFLWHLGQVAEAKHIYNQFLEKSANESSFLYGTNRAITQLNYGVVELIFGDIREARSYVDAAYAARKNFNFERTMPNLLSFMGVVYGRCGEVNRGVDFAIEGLKLTYWRGSSREAHLNMEWACGLLVLGGFRAEAWNVMGWINLWRIRTLHSRSVSELRYYDSLGLHEFQGGELQIREDEEYRVVMGFLIKLLRRVQENCAGQEAIL
ncbi:hypothetical protein C0431_14055 [bacterium]|nr:hypothetical protein [bacterium]